MRLGKKTTFVLVGGGAVTTLVIGLLALVFVAPRVVAHYSWSVERLFRQAPEQPIRFTHATHAGEAGISCTFCHRDVEKAAAATVPSLEQCMFCHRVITGTTDEKQAEIAKLRANAGLDAEGNPTLDPQPVDWVRVHRLPDHVRFVHEPHIRASFDCATCHGQVESMVELRQFRSLKMGDCVACHRQNNATTDCAACHY